MAQQMSSRNQVIFISDLLSSVNRFYPQANSSLSLHIGSVLPRLFFSFYILHFQITFWGTTCINENKMISSYVSFKVRKSVKPQILPHIPLGPTIIPDPILVKQNKTVLIGLEQSFDDDWTLGSISFSKFPMSVKTLEYTRSSQMIL